MSEDVRGEKRRGKALVHACQCLSEVKRSTNAAFWLRKTAPHGTKVAAYNNIGVNLTNAYPQSLVKLDVHAQTPVTSSKMAQISALLLKTLTKKVIFKYDAYTNSSQAQSLKCRDRSISAKNGTYTPVTARDRGRRRRLR